MDKWVALATRVNNSRELATKPEDVVHDHSNQFKGLIEAQKGTIHK